MTESIEQEQTIYSVSQLNQEVRALLEYALPHAWIEGEISNLRTPGSGHLYFTLKDAHAQVRCALFRNRFQMKNIQPKEGMHVLVRANVSLYEERGDFQLIIEHIEEVGDGALRRAFEALKHRLTEEGLFDNTHKKTLPEWPTCVGIVTSPTGAAIRDILSVLERRFAALPVIIYPTQVQGSQAADQIVHALSLANLRKECDVLILARGGGSLEDLWPFNEERVARAIYRSKIPVVTGIGHEVDFTIADFVADQRAPTPSAAAELISPDINKWWEILIRIKTRLEQSMQHSFRHTALLLEQLEKRLPHPQRRLEEQGQRLDGLSQRLDLAQKNLLQHQWAFLQHLVMRLQQHTPLHGLQTALLISLNLEKRLKSALPYQLKQMQEKLTYLMQALDSVSPLNTLNRGYAIATQEEKILKDIADVDFDKEIQVRLAKGLLVGKCRVD